MLPFVRHVVNADRRPARQRLLDMLPKDSIGAEIGVWKGDFSEEILRTVRPKELHLVDPWVFQPQYPDRWYGGLVAAEQAEMDSIYRGVCSRFAANPAIRIHRRFSRELRDIFSDRSLDWVYVDGDHSKDAVKLDVHLALDVIKPGGMVTGDDYYWRDSDGSHPVKDAVDELARERGLHPRVVDSQFVIVVDHSA
jgi:hypothetical protein